MKTHWLRLLLIATAGCSTGEVPFGTSSVIVFGTVTRGGAVLSGARVYSYLCFGPCGTPPMRGAAETTDAAGHCRQLIQLPFSEQQGCLTVRALVDRGSTTDSVTVSDVSVLLKDDARPGPPDSTRIDIAFP